MTSVDEIAGWLADPANAHSVRGFPAGQRDVEQAGLYAWFADDDGRQMLAAAFGRALPSLIYAGQAGATSKRSGTTRVATLGSRIRRNHLHGNIGSSTFRRTLTALLFEPLGLVLDRPGKLSTSSAARVSEWMCAHLSVATFASPDRARLAALEDDVLSKDRSSTEPHEHAAKSTAPAAQGIAPSARIATRPDRRPGKVDRSALPRLAIRADRLRNRRETVHRDLSKCPWFCPWVACPGIWP